MKSTFIANGPDFKCGYEQATMNSVDIYPLICKIAGLRQCHQSSGEVSSTEALLSTDACHVSSTSLLHLNVMLLLLGVVVVPLANIWLLKFSCCELPIFLGLPALFSIFLWIVFINMFYHFWAFFKFTCMLSKLIKASMSFCLFSRWHRWGFK